jgi:hypothetical protein
MAKKYYKILTLIVAFLILGLVMVTSYAYYTANVSGNNSSNNVITSGYMEITFENDFDDEIQVVGMLPGNTETKRFSVRNTGTTEAYYDIYVNNVINNFEIKSDLHCKLQESNLGVIYDGDCPHLSGKLVSGINIDYNAIHNYTFEVSFLERDANQDPNQGRTFSTEINLKETESYMVSQLYNRYYNGETDLEFDGVTTLGELGTPDNNLRYIDGNPNNYVYFNCSTNAPEYMNDETCEKWRIIGAMSNIENNEGESSVRVKIIRDEPIGQYSWDSSDESIRGGAGVVQWGPSTYDDGRPYEGADLMRELNNDYFGNVVVGTDGYWYMYRYNSYYYDNYGRDDPIYGIPPTKNITNNSNLMIEDALWHSASLGAIYENRTLHDVYKMERGTHVDNPIYYDNDHIVRNTKWVGKVALPYPSDLIYSLIKESEDDKLSNYDCTQNFCLKMFPQTEPFQHDGHALSWLYKNGVLTLTGQNNATYCLSCVMYSDLTTFGTQYPAYTINYSNFVYPTVYLRDVVKIVSGDGSESNPYKLAVMSSAFPQH